ncbi:hypothetical protein BC829DRAFT_395565 [Chytridium lagenaria]|nr:hypothetical protein BC829DRAFT_395565 [Chytridium lagenaria]
MASHSIAARFNMNDRFASIDDDDDIISLGRDRLNPAIETQLGLESDDEYKQEDDGNRRDNSEDTTLDVGAERQGPMETIFEDSDEMYDLGSLALNLNAAVGHSAVTDFESPIDYNTPSATDTVPDAFFDNVFWRMTPLYVDLPILAPIDSNNSSLNLMKADVDVPKDRIETTAEVTADAGEEVMSLAEDLVNASDAHVGHEGGVDVVETEGAVEADAGSCGDGSLQLGQHVPEPTLATSPAINVAVTETIKKNPGTIAQERRMLMLAERFALHGSRNARQPPSQEELRRIALVMRFKK